MKTILKAIKRAIVDHPVGFLLLLYGFTQTAFFWTLQLHRWRKISGKLESITLEDKLITSLSFKINNVTRAKSFDYIISNNGTVVGIKISGDTTVIVIRGSYSVENWSDNIGIKQVYSPKLGIKVSHGYNTILNEILPELLPYITNARKIIVTGHSLGGAIACMLGIYIDRYYIGKLSMIYAYGNPRFTTQQYNIPIKQYHIVKDPVPYLPAYTIFTRFKHCGEKIILINGNWIIVKDTWYNSLLLSSMIQIGRTEINAHQKYLKKII